MRIFSFAINLDWFGIPDHNSIKNIYNEIYPCALFLPIFPVVIELLIFLTELLEFMANEKTCYMVVIMRADQRLRSHFLYRRWGPQPSGALRCPDTWRSCQGFAWCALSHGARLSRYAGCQESEAVSFKIRCQAPEESLILSGLSKWLLVWVAVRAGWALPFPGFSTE